MTARAAAKTRGQATRDKILAVALGLFRKKGLERTTMRDIATAAGVAVGGAYYYFPSKESLVHAYYEETQVRRAARARAVLDTSEELRERLVAVLHGSLDVVARDRKLVGALFASVAAPDSPLSIFAPETRKVRDESIALFAEALAREPLPEELRDVAGHALWALHMGVLLYFIHDTSPGQARTRRLVDQGIDLLVEVLPLAPMMAPLGARLRGILAEAGLAPAAPQAPAESSPSR